jgi:ferric-dicitrate binding protein FerR (iron transport regulator)
MNKQDYLKKWLDGNLTREEAKAEGRLPEYESLEKLSRAVQAFKAPGFSIEAAYERFSLSRQTAPKAEAKEVRLNWWNPALKIAAAVTLLVVAYVYFFRHTTTMVETLAMQRTTVTLPDGSTVVLNASSTLEYNKGNWAADRKVMLDGEGYFRVAKGSKFKVVSATGTVRVLGTEFNVKDRPGFFEVICYEGSVRVQNNEASGVLRPSEVFRIVDGKVYTNIKTASTKPGWTEGESVFESVPFAQVVHEFERQYNVTISLRNVDTSQLYTGSFTHSDKDLALKSLTLPLNLSMKLQGDEILLTGERE